MANWATALFVSNPLRTGDPTGLQPATAKLLGGFSSYRFRSTFLTYPSSVSGTEVASIGAGGVSIY